MERIFHMLTVKQLHIELEKRNLPTDGLKADLIERLKNDLRNNDSNQDTIQPAESFSSNIDDMNTLEVSAEVHRSESMQTVINHNEDYIEDENLVDDQVYENRRMNLFEWEHKLIERENQLLKKENRNLKQKLTEGDNGCANGKEKLDSRQISDLVPEFRGVGDSIDEWFNRIRVINRVYSVEETVLKLIVIGKLRDSALKWFHSRSDNVFYSLDELMCEMKKIFDTRPNKLELRKQFEKRKWLPDEQFTNYYTDKVVLANKVPVNNEELVEYLIDGFDNSTLQSQARIQNFKTPEEVLNSFSRITKEDRNEIRQPRLSNEYFTKRPLRCFNCNEIGHHLSKCSKPVRPRGSCYECGSQTHFAKNCPMKIQHYRQEQTDTTQNTNIEPHIKTSNVNVCELRSHSAYLFNLFIEIDKAYIQIESLVDTGSPISLIKESIVPKKSLIEDMSGLSFSGINNSKFDILGIFETNININNNIFKILFRVVPDTVIPNNCLLGRNFTMLPGIKIIVGQNLKIEIDQDFLANKDETFEDKIFNIEYSSINELELNVSKTENFSKSFYELFSEGYIKPIRPLDPKVKYEMKIDLSKTVQPFYFSPKRLSFAEKETVSKIITELLDSGFIRKSFSQYSSRIVLVKKKNGDVRMCVDFRELNKLTVRDRFPLPIIEDHLINLRDKKYFTTLDLRNGFFHMKLSESARKYTAFTTHLGHYEFTVCPFGLCNAPSNFQRLISEIFFELIQSNEILVYIDDILIASQTITDHFCTLRKVFKIIVENKLELNLSKCLFVQSKIKYLGYNISSEGISPSDDHISAIRNYPIPKNDHELKGFVGLMSFFRKFIQNFSVIAKPLYDLLRKDSRFIFGQSQLNSFEILRNHLISAPVLKIYSPFNETELHCDASCHGYGAVLLQKQSEDNELHPVMFYSKRSSDAESRYHSFELEMLSVVYAIQRFHVYLQGIKFKIITDCNSLALALSKKDINPRISRWILILQNYDYDVHHREGTRMRHVDALSRNHILLFLDGSLESAMIVAQNADPDIVKLRDMLSRQESKFWELRNGVVYRKSQENLLFYVPSAMQHNIIRTCHDDVGHIGIDKAYELVKRSYWFPKIKENIASHISNCLDCIAFSAIENKHREYLQNIDKGSMPFQTVHLDHYGPLNQTSLKNKYILLIIDAFTKFIKLNPTKTTNTREVVAILEKYCRDYGTPARIISDRGSCFTSSEMDDFIKKKDIFHVCVATSCPRANGQAERFNRFLTPMLAKLCNDSNWDKILCDVEYIMNNTINRSIGTTPFMALYGINQRKNSCDKIKQFLDEGNQIGKLCVEEIRNAAVLRNAEVQRQNKVYYDKKVNPVRFKVGDYIVIRNIPSSGHCNKLSPKFKGPYIVKEELPNFRYLVADPENFQLGRNPFSGVFEASNMKKWLSLSNSENDGEFREINEELIEE